MKALIYWTTFFMGWGIFGQICLAERAYISDSFEVTFRTGPSVENRVLLMLVSGEPVDVLEPGDDWTRVRLLEGENKDSEGWVFTRYLSPQIPWELKANRLEKQNKQLKADFNQIRKEHQDLVEREKRISGDLQEKVTALDHSNNLYKQLRSEASDYITLKDQYTSTKTRLESSEHQVQVLADENNKMRSSQNITWFSLGALVLLFGLLIGFTIGRQQKKSKSLIYD